MFRVTEDAMITATEDTDLDPVVDPDPAVVTAVQDLNLAQDESIQAVNMIDTAVIQTAEVEHVHDPALVLVPDLVHVPVQANTDHTIDHIKEITNPEADRDLNQEIEEIEIMNVKTVIADLCLEIEINQTVMDQQPLKMVMNQLQKLIS